MVTRAPIGSVWESCRPPDDDRHLPGPYVVSADDGVIYTLTSLVTEHYFKATHPALCELGRYRQTV